VQIEYQLNLSDLITGVPDILTIAPDNVTLCLDFLT